MIVTWLLLLGFGFVIAEYCYHLITKEITFLRFRRALRELSSRGVQVRRRRGGWRVLWVRWVEVDFEGVTIKVYHYYQAMAYGVAPVPGWIRGLRLTSELSENISRSVQLKKRRRFSAPSVPIGDKELDEAVWFTGVVSTEQLEGLKEEPLRSMLIDGVEYCGLQIRAGELFFEFEKYPHKGGGLIRALEGFVQVKEALEASFDGGLSQGSPATEEESEWEAADQVW